MDNYIEAMKLTETLTRTNSSRQPEKTPTKRKKKSPKTKDQTIPFYLNELNTEVELVG